MKKIRFELYEKTRFELYEKIRFELYEKNMCGRFYLSIIIF